MNLSVPSVIALLILIYIPNSTVSQNCGVPRFVNVKQSDRLTETLDTGQILTTIPAINVEKIRNVTRNPNDFALVSIDVETKSLVLTVNKPFWSQSNPTKSYIDSERVKEIEISVELECIDGQTKEIVFRVPIIDENTELPRFEKQEYNLTTEPCITDRCVLAFEQEVVIIDEDRDEENAVLKISTDSDEIEVLTNLVAVEPWYITESDGRTTKGFQFKAKMAYTPRNNSHQKYISFTMLAENAKEPMNELSHIAKSNITITFEESLDRLLPPVLSSPFYYAEVLYFGETVKIRPQEILATVPWDDDHETNHISYKFSGFPSVFDMNSKTGKIKFASDIEETTLDDLRNTGEVTFYITAERTKRVGDGGSINFTSTSSRAAFVVFFSNLIGDPINSTTEYPTCSPECYSTPFPGTCPTPICPDPEPCPITTTQLPTTYEPDPTSTMYSTYPSEATNTMPSESPLPTSAPTEPPSTENPTTEPPSTEAPTTEPPSTEAPTTEPPSTEAPTAEPPSTGAPTTERSSTMELTTSSPETSFPSTFEPSTTDADVTETSANPSTLDPTTEHYESTTPPQLSTTNATQSPTEQSEATTAFTTVSSSYSTFTTPSSPPTTITYPSTTSPPTSGNCTCNCDIFLCNDPATKPSKNSTYYSEYPDPHNCTQYHRCSNGSDYSTSHRCPPGKVYCPINTACETVEDCLELYRLSGKIWRGGYGGGYTSSEESEENPCEECECGRIPPGHRGNTCEDSNYSGDGEQSLEDPKYCDIFHKCQSDGYSGFHDYRMMCQPGLIFCKALNMCTYHDHEGCQCPSHKTFKQCDVCKMGLWENFDIFTKQFRNGSYEIM
ncbi:unnamed protein product [Orchesella dallaii]